MLTAFSGAAVNRWSPITKTCWLRPQEIYPLLVLEARSSESRCPQGHLPSRAGWQGEHLFSASSSFWQLRPVSICGPTASLSCVSVLQGCLTFSAHRTTQDKPLLSRAFTY